MHCYPWVQDSIPTRLTSPLPSEHFLTCETIILATAFTNIRVGDRGRPPAGATEWESVGLALAGTGDFLVYRD